MATKVGIHIMEDHTTPRVFINETTIKCQLDIRYSARVLRLQEGIA